MTMAIGNTGNIGTSVEQDPLSDPVLVTCCDDDAAAASCWTTSGDDGQTVVDVAMNILSARMSDPLLSRR